MIMSRNLLSLFSATVALGGAAVAQCSNYTLSPAGTVLIDADDAIYNVALPFPFPFNGAIYNSITVSTNGWIKLGPATATSSQTGDTEALMLSDDPRIAVCWDDLNPSSTSGSGALYSDGLLSFHTKGKEGLVYWAANDDLIGRGCQAP